jgi:ADP-ribose pyrophosphatase YjhB (NUDIX family)
LRRSIASLAIFRGQEGGRTLWLARWNDNWRRLNLVGGHKLPEESFRDCIQREVTEELGLVADVDFRCADEPLAHLEYTAWSHSAGEETAYVIELFDVELCGETAHRMVAGDPMNCWLSSAEILVGSSDDGRPVSETTAQLLTKAGLFSDAGRVSEKTRNEKAGN